VSFCLKQAKLSANGVRKIILFLFELRILADNLAFLRNSSLNFD